MNISTGDFDLMVIMKTAYLKVGETITFFGYDNSLLALFLKWAFNKEPVTIRTDYKIKHIVGNTQVLLECNDVQEL